MTYYFAFRGIISDSLANVFTLIPRCQTKRAAFALISTERNSIIEWRVDIKLNPSCSPIAKRHKPSDITSQEELCWESAWHGPQGQQPVIKSMTEIEKRGKRKKKTDGNSGNKKKRNKRNQERTEWKKKVNKKITLGNYQSRRATRRWQVPCLKANTDTGLNRLARH